MNHQKLFFTINIIFYGLVIFILKSVPAQAYSYCGMSCYDANGCGTCYTSSYCLTYASGNYGPYCTPHCNPYRTRACLMHCEPCDNTQWCPAPVSNPIPTTAPIVYTSFNGVVYDPDGVHRWTPGSNCASYQGGVNITSSKGEIAWVPDENGGHFDVYNVPANQEVIVTLTPPEGCNLQCDKWSMSTGSNGTGCVVTFVAVKPDYSQTINFTLKKNCTPSCACASSTCVSQQCSNGCGGWCSGTLEPNCIYKDYTITNPTCGGPTRQTVGTSICNANCPTIYDGCHECETCSDQCGQTQNCGGICPHPTCERPSAPTNIFPNNSQSTPYVVETNTIDLTWSDPQIPNNFYSFNLHVQDLTANKRINCTSTSPYSFCKQLFSSIHTYKFPAPGVLTQNHLYHWWIDAERECPCSSDINEGPSSEGYFIYSPNSSPEFDGLIIKNDTSDEVLPENTDKNHICQNDFHNNRTVTFEVKVHDDDGNSDISEVHLRWNGQEFTQTSFDTANGLAIFSVPNLDNSLNNNITYPLEVKVVDSRGHTANNTEWINSGRNFKIWDCKIPVSGNIYQRQNNENTDCSSSSADFQNLVSDVNFTSLIYINSTSGDKSMKSTSASSYVNFPNNELIWGKTYGYNFNPDIKLSSPIIRVPNNVTNNSTCQTAITVDNTVIDPYSEVSPSLNLDFSSTIISDPWFQTSAGGINAIKNIVDRLPSTCSLPDCIPAVAKNNPNDASNNGTLLAQAITKGCNTCLYGYPKNWSIIQTRSSFPENYNYKYFYNLYPAKVYPDQTNLSQIITDNTGSGVVYVNGTLNIDNSNPDSSNKLFMVIVKNNINIQNTVDQLEGIFVADGNISATGQSDNQLIINGILYSASLNVSFTRNFSEPIKNNSQPIVQVNYRPDLIFKLPTQFTNVFTLYQAGI